MELDSVRVLDLTRLLPGPYATQLLADMGAEVVKIEDTDAGDYARLVPPYTDAGVGSVFDAVNRGKRSVALDLKSEEGQDALLSLVEDADVLIESFRPGVVDRLGIDYETVSERNEEIVYCSLTGYGQAGPLSEKVGHDLNYVGRAGLLSLTREDADSPPVIPGYPIADMAGGLFAAFGTVSALLDRELGDGTGEYIDVAMTDVVLSFAQPVAYDALNDDGLTPGETELTGALPWYSVYETADGEHVTFAALEPQFYEAFCEAVGREDLTGMHNTTDAAEREALREELTEIFRSRTREEWTEELAGVEASVEPVYSPSEAVDQEQVAAREMVWDESRPRIGFPALGSDPPQDSGRPLPAQGEHTAEVLAAHGYDEAEIERLADDGVILTGD
jgi:alpha-methylacyl-CoA racemase